MEVAEGGSVCTVVPGADGAVVFNVSGAVIVLFGALLTLDGAADPLPPMPPVALLLLLPPARDPLVLLVAEAATFAFVNFERGFCADC